MTMDECTSFVGVRNRCGNKKNWDVQGETVSPTIREVLNINFFIRLSLSLTPKKKTLFCGQTLFTVGEVLLECSIDIGLTTHLISAIVNRRISVQIIPRMSFIFPSIISRCSP